MATCTWSSPVIIVAPSSILILRYFVARGQARAALSPPPRRAVRGSEPTRSIDGGVMKFAWLCSHESYQPEDLVQQAVAAEEAGFDAVLGSDHFHPWVDDTSAAGFVWSWLGAVAVQTRRRAARHRGDLPAVPLPPGAGRADGGDHRPAVRRPADARRRHRRGAQRAPDGLPLPRLRRAAGPDAGGAGDHAPDAGRGEGDLPRRALHDRDRQAVLAAQGRRADPDGRGRPEVGDVRRHLRRTG